MKEQREREQIKISPHCLLRGLQVRTSRGHRNPPLTRLVDRGTESGPAPFGPPNDGDLLSAFDRRHSSNARPEHNSRVVWDGSRNGFRWFGVYFAQNAVHSLSLSLSNKTPGKSKSNKSTSATSKAEQCIRELHSRSAFERSKEWFKYQQLSK